MSINLSDILHNKPTISPTIYGYILPSVPDHEGYIKVGYTDRDDVEQRIKEQLHTSALSHKTVFVEDAMRADGTCFTDHDIHRILKRKGKKQLNFGEDRNEWYQCTVNDLKNAVIELKSGRRVEENRVNAFEMRAEQRRAVEDTVSYYLKMQKEEPANPPKYLWNAKMRFGKTFATYQLAKKMQMKRVLILTFKPAVESAWQEDLMTHIDFEGWQFVSDKEAKGNSMHLDTLYDACDKEKPIVVFGSFQNLLGTNEAGGIKAKNEFIHSNNWDLVVFDEYHFGAWRDSAKKLFTEIDEEDLDFDYDKYAEDESGNAINETWLPITTRHYLYLSGTPFRALNSGEFLEDQIFNWTYSDEQNEKNSWDSKKGKNPYASLPRMVMLTYKVPESITEVAINEGYDEFDINEFFKADFEKGHVEEARFIYEEYVQKWLRMIRGELEPVDGLKLGNERPPMPYSDTTLLNVLSHTLWFLPNVASCYAMKNLLEQKQNNFFADYKIIVCAGTKAGIGLDALEPVKNAMGNPLESKTITLSCGKLTTGVTVRPWSGIFMLRNLKSPETYFQAAFRVQSPWEVMDENGDKKIVKEECYIFDFALERALRQVADYSMKLKVDDTSPEKKVGEFINFLPILAFDGAAMNAISAQDVLDITYAGTSATLLAKRWQTALLVHVDNDTLKKLRENDEALNALMNIEGFRTLNDNIETIINRSEKVKQAKKEKGDDLTPKEKKELSDEEKEAKSLRKQVQENLLKLAARIPAFMYLTDYREQCIKDVITQIEPELFKKITGLSVTDFDVLCSIGLFDPEKMNQGIFGFRRYENASLSYTGIDMHEGEDIGGWDTVLKREEYDVLYANQRASMVKTEKVRIDIEPVRKTSIAAVKKKIPENIEDVKQHTVISYTVTMENSEKELQEMIAGVKKGAKVSHKAFGEGEVIKMTSDHKIYVKFQVGQKMFIFPDAFVKGFLVLI